MYEHHAVGEKPSKQRFRANTTNENQTDPVTLVFGRPDIGAYLRYTFAIQTEAPGTGHDPLADEPALGTAVVDLEKLRDDVEVWNCSRALSSASIRRIYSSYYRNVCAWRYHSTDGLWGGPPA